MSEDWLKKFKIELGGAYIASLNRQKMQKLLANASHIQDREMRRHESIKLIESYSRGLPLIASSIDPSKFGALLDAEKNGILGLVACEQLNVGVVSLLLSGIVDNRVESLAEPMYGWLQKNEITDIVQIQSTFKKGYVESLKSLMESHKLKSIHITSACKEVRNVL